jgi:RNA polymerase sigma factor (TIGR02999 family)
MPDDSNLSKLLGRWGADGAARDEVVTLVYDELRRIAHRYINGERVGHTLQTTALVNEAYLGMVELNRVQWTDRSHFFAMAATLMRRILVDYARQRARDKRGGGISIVTLDGQDVAAETAVDITALDAALERLAALDPAQARIVELRFFSGLTVDETAAALDISPSTVKREWASAKARLERLRGRGDEREECKSSDDSCRH